jgi:hypothetical protein
MKRLTLTSKILLLLTICFFSVWLGGYIARLIAVYPLFDPIELTVKSLYVSHLEPVFYTLLPLIILNLISFACFLITFFLFLFTSKLNLKINGWLFIIFLIIVITAPFEIYLSAIDFKIVKAILNNISDVNPILDMVKERMVKLSSFSLIEVFSYLAVIFLALFQPLTKKNEN